MSAAARRAGVAVSEGTRGKVRTARSRAAAIFGFAANVDPTVRATLEQLRRLASKRVTPRPYSRGALFESMAAGRIALLSGLRVPVLGSTSRHPVVTLTQAIRRSFSPREAVVASGGPGASRRRVTVRHLLQMWQRDDTIVSITDLHIRETPLGRVLDTRALSDFNILCTGSEDVAWHEMMTMVMSSRGAVTDSHSDDPDGSNHCFAGRKLWLVWDTFEGRRFGLQDVERDWVRQTARFSIEQFLRVPSARWFVISPGVTLFLPGNYTHKVITLERYLGVGSFYLSAPNAIRTVGRWLTHGPLWLDDGVRGNDWALVDEMAETASATIRAWRQRSPAQQEQRGLQALRASVRHWTSDVSEKTRRRLLRRPSFRNLLAEVSR